MQTFLPYKNYLDSALSLDNKRLGKQRVEVLQILNCLAGKSSGWKNHPAVKMWRGWEIHLQSYGVIVCKVWRDKGFKDTCLEKIQDGFDKVFDCGNNYLKEPPWLTDEFCNSHRSNLLRKDSEFYGKYNWNVPDNLPYIWPVR